MANVENKRWLCVDPGETTGWSVWKGEKLLGGGQTPLWEFAHDVHDALADNIGPLAERERDMLRPRVRTADNTAAGDKAFDLIVCEKFVLYPWVIYQNGRPTHALDFEEFRTVQLIGALTFMATLHDIELHTQPASIKERAMAGGAGESFVHPLRENRHENDSIMHGYFYVQVECRGVNLPIPDGAKTR